MQQISTPLLKRIRILYCYAQRDSTFCEQLDQHLAVLKNSGLIETWSNLNISRAIEPKQEIAPRVDSPDLILLLVSPAFMEADYHNSVEMQKAMQRMESGECLVLPILLRSTAQWQATPFGQLQTLPKNSKPITNWRNRDEAWYDVVTGIRQIVNELQISQTTKVDWVNEGDRYMKLKQYDDALAAYEQALHLDPQNVAAYLGQGNALSALNKFTEALNSYNQAIPLAPNNHLAYLSMGDALYNLHQYAEALVAYDQALHISPKNNVIYINKGHVFRELHQYEDALSAYEQALQLSSNDVAAYLYKGDMLLQLQRYEEALVYYDTAIAFDPSNTHAFQAKAVILGSLGRYVRTLLISEKTMQLGLNAGIITLEEGASVLKSRKPSDEQIEFVQQFLLSAGFDHSELRSDFGFLVPAKIPIWKGRFPRGLYVHILFDSPLDQRSVRSIYQHCRRYSDHALVIINMQPAISGWGEINVLRGEQGQDHFVCLPIDEALIQKGVVSNSELFILKSYIDERLGKEFDPYDVRDPVSDAVSFFGRQRLTEELLGALRQGQRRGLFGIHKMGKSSVLHELQKRAEFPVAYVYLKIDDDLSSIYSRIIDDWVANGRLKYRDFNWTKPLATSTVSQGDFHATAKGLLAYLGTITDQQLLLGIFLDEIERILPSEGDESKLRLCMNLLDSLRGLQQETNSLALLVAGIHPSIARRNYFWGNQKNPMHQVIVETFLPPLGEEDCSNMIRSLGQQINIQYEGDALNYILEMSGSHPFLARQICSLACKKRKDMRAISLDIVKEVVREFVRNPSTASYFDEDGLWKELSQPDLWGDEVGKANHLLLRTLADSGQDLSEQELYTCVGIDKKVALKAFYALKERCIISSPDDSGYYRITFGLFRDWIRFHQLGVE